MKRFVYFLGFLLISLLANIQQVKADSVDTIHYYLPHEQVFLCVDTNNFPTFVVYKPNGFGDVVWNFNGQFNGTGDSIIFTPTNVGTYAVDALWGVNIQGMFINLYGEAPPSPDFVGTNGGIINATGDTAWMCAPSITVSAHNIYLEEANSRYWTGPNDFYVEDNPITVSTPGTYYFTRSNPCGTTVDSIEVVSLPNELPIIEDVLRCNEDWGDPLDPGPGWFSYHWSSLFGTIEDSTSQVLYLDSSLSNEGWGFIYLSLTNACISGELEIEIERQTFPLPDLAAFSANPGTLCHDEVAILTPYLDAQNVYSMCEWSRGGVNLGDGFTYTVNHEQGNGWYKVEAHKGSCMASDEILVQFYPNPTSPTLCVSTFDPQVGKNKIVFQHNDSDAMDYILCDSLGTGWRILDSIVPNEGVGLGAIFEMYDTINNPDEQSRIYTVFARHQCGHLSFLEDWNKTILVGIVENPQNHSQVLQIWEQYQTLGGYVPSGYAIWMDQYNDGNLVQIGVLEGHNTNFVISNPIEGAAYYASVELPWNDCALKDGSKSSVTVYSNKSVYGGVGIKESAAPIKVFPNPSDGIFHFDGDVQISSIKVFDRVGRLILSEVNDNTINLTNFGSGMYFAKIQTANGPAATVKLIIQ